MFTPDQDLSQALESAVVVAWDDLVQAGKPGLVHIRYRFAADRSLANLEVWVSEISGHWMLVCEYPGASAAGIRNLTFSDGCRSSLLAQGLGFIIGHQDAFARAPLLDRDSLIQVQVPTEDEKARARRLMNELLPPVVLAKAS
jgi:hypothetical protein